MFVGTSGTVVNNAAGFAASINTVTDETCGDGTGAIDIDVTGGSLPYTFAWDSGESTEDISGISGGTYEVTVTDNNACSIVLQGTVNNITGTLAVANDIIGDASCTSLNGYIDLTITGGATPYTFAWDSGQSTEDISGMSPGTYNCTITDNAGCMVNYSGTINSTGGLITTNAVITDEICGNGEGQIDVTVTGGISPFTYSWVGASPSNCCDYTLDMVDASTSWNGASVTVLLDGISIGDFTVLGGGANVETFTACDGQSIELIWSAGGFDNEVSFDLLDPSGAIIFSQGPSPTVGSLFTTTGSCPSGAPNETSVSNLNSGTYQLTVTDNVGCEIVENYAVQNNLPNLQLTPTSVVDDQCLQNQGEIIATATGALAPLDFTLNGNPDGFFEGQFNNLTSGTYTLMVVDGNGCQESMPVTIANQSTFTTSVVTVTDENCEFADGTIDIDVAGTGTNFSYTWSNGATTQDVSGLAAGSYTCTISDLDNFCDDNITVDVLLNPGFTLQSVSTDESCGDGSGDIDVTVNGGTLPITYSWDNGATTEDISGLSEGEYTVTATDNIGCTVELSDTINNNTGTLTVTDAITDENCANGAGEINLTVTGGVSPYTFAWSNTETTEDITGLSAGNYTCVILDNAGCSINYSGDVNDSFGGMSTDTVIVNETCNQSNGSIEVTVNGGVSPYIFSWTGATPNPCCSYTLDMQDTFGDGWDGAFVTVLINGVSIGDFTVNAGGSEIATIPICDGESIELVYTAGDFENEHFYTLYDTQGNTLFADGTDPSTGSVYTGTGSCVPPPGSTEISGLSSGSYDLTITDDSGCSLTQTYSVQASVSTLDLVLTGITDDQCLQDQGQVQATSNGGVAPTTLTLDGQPETFPGNFFGIGAGDYLLMVEDNEGCQDTMTVTVGNQSTFTTTVVTIVDENCGDADGTVDIEVAGTGTNYSYDWDNGATTQDLSGLSAGSYTCTITDIDNTCDDIITVTLVNTADFAVSNVIVDESCGDGLGSIDLTITGGTGLTYTWDSGETTEDISNLSAGTYTCTIVDGSTGCTYSESFSVVNTTTGIMVSSTTSDENCGNADGSINLTVSGGSGNYTYAWDTGATSEDLTGIPSGVYTVDVTDDNDGCTITESITIQTSASTVSLTTPTITDDQCLQDQGQVQAGYTGGVAPVTLTLDGQNETFPGNFMNVGAGDYLLMVVDNDGCEDTLTITVGNQATFTTSIVAAVDENCDNADGSIDIEVAGTGTNFAYTWDNGDNTQDISGLAAGTYTCLITDIDNLCNDEITIQLVNTSDFTASTVVVDEDCGDGSGSIDLTISGATNLSYLWNIGETTEDVSNLSAGTYSCEIINDDTGCSMSIDVDVMNVTNGMVVSAVSTDETCGDGAGSINNTVTGGSGSYSYAWSNGETTEDVTNLSAGTYTVTVTDNGDGCTTTETVVVGNDANFTVNDVVNNATCSTCADGSIDVSIGEIIPDGPYTYNWSNGATTQDVSGLLPGTYTVTVTGASGCSVTETYIVENAVGISTVDNNWQLNVYPNPAKDQFRIDFNFNSSTDVRFEMLNMVGQLLEESTIMNSAGSRIVDVDRFESGMYLLRFTDGVTQKIVRVNISK